MMNDTFQLNMNASLGRINDPGVTILRYQNGACSMMHNRGLNTCGMADTRRTPKHNEGEYGTLYARMSGAAGYKHQHTTMGGICAKSQYE